MIYRHVSVCVCIITIVLPSEIFSGVVPDESCLEMMQLYPAFDVFCGTEHRANPLVLLGLCLDCELMSTTAIHYYYYIKCY